MATKQRFQQQSKGNQKMDATTQAQTLESASGEEAQVQTLELPSTDVVIEAVPAVLVEDTVQVNEEPKALEQVVVETPKTPEPKIEPVAVKATVQTNDNSVGLQGLIDTQLASGDRVAIDTINGLLEYVKEMRPGKQMDPTTGARNQLTMIRTMQFMVNSNSKDFQSLFATVLKLIDENKVKGCFSAIYIARFVESMTSNKSDIECFYRFMNMMTTLSAVNGRQQAVRQIDFTRTLQFGFTDEGRQRISAFFNL
jgi:hypothetical protein